jgi:hypothetical protein
MNPRLRLFVLIVAALLAGLALSELLCRSKFFRDLAGRLSGRGHLIALTNGKGIYETDLGRGEESDASDLIAAENLKRAAANEMVDPAYVEREFSLTAAQFADEKVFHKALLSNGFSIRSLREKMETQLRGLAWLEKQVAPAIVASESECRQFYDAHLALFTQPVRFRVSHLFLAAHAETPPEVVEEKEMAIAALATRLGKAETFSQLAAEASEDEATKFRGGDLGYFSEARMPPEFIAEIKKLRAGEISKPFRSHLGFHIAQLTEIKLARPLSFEEARPEILVALANDRRAILTRQITQDLSAPN